MGKYYLQEKYEKENVIRTSLKLNKRTDADLIEFLESCGNKQGTIKLALRNLMKDVGGNEESK